MTSLLDLRVLKEFFFFFIVLRFIGALTRFGRVQSILNPKRLMSALLKASVVYTSIYIDKLSSLLTFTFDFYINIDE